MSDSYFSPHWYRVSDLKPRLSSQIEILRHDYRGMVWYLLREPISGNNYRFNSSSYQAIAQMDGETTVEDIFLVVGERLGTYAPSQDDMINLLSKLAESDLIDTDSPVAAAVLGAKQRKVETTKRNSKLRNPLAVRIPLWDPDQFLVRHLNKVRWCFGVPMALVWFMVAVYAGYHAITSWSVITSHFAINALQPNNLLLMVLLYPPIKFIHELGHAFATKLEGGEVHEMGINILFLIPVPYVNVSSSALFRNKYKRMLVSSMGILIELFIAAIGVLLFLSAQPGIVQDIGFNMLLIGGISSVFFNGNPLMKFDGYYILSDAVAIPNLYQRSSRFLLFLIQRYILGMAAAHSPVTAPGEGRWFLIYGLSSLLYRFSINWMVCTIVINELGAAGLILAILLLFLQFGIPVLNGIIWLLSDPTIGGARSRALFGSLAAISAIAAILFLVPVGSTTNAEGVVWAPEDAQLKVGADGFVSQVNTRGGQLVTQGQTIAELEDQALESQSIIAQSRLEELRVEMRAARTKDPVQAALIREELKVAESELSHVKSKVASMELKAMSDGELVLLEADDLEGRFLRKGDVIGYVLGGPPNTVRVVVPQSYIGQIQERVEDVQVRFANDPGTSLVAHVMRQVPQAIDRLPSAALSTLGGGKFVVDPSKPGELATMASLFVVDLQLKSGTKTAPLGTRAYVKFYHGKEPLAQQWSRRVSQTFLRLFDV